jgi:hypothetical protein
MNMCNHFVMNSSNSLFDDHEQGLNENVFEDHETTEHR